MKNKFILATLSLTLCSLYACANTNSIARTHPEAVSGRPNCSECHSDSSLGSLNHQAADFLRNHGRFAAAGRQACATCHQESFCTDCHTRKSDLKPSDRYADQPARSFPHRGDYLSQHQFDGRVNPAACAKCHGRQNNARCTSCHK